MQYVTFTQYEIPETADWQAVAQGGVSSVQALINQLLFTGASAVILSGLGLSAQSTPNGTVQVGTGQAWQSGQSVAVTAIQTANIITGTPNTAQGIWGTGQAADGTNPRIDLVAIQYATTVGSTGQRDVVNPNTGAQTLTQVNLTVADSFQIQVIHGTAAATPVAPAVPVGWFGLGTVLVPANATTVTASDITDLTTQSKISGGALGNVTGQAFTRNDTDYNAAPVFNFLDNTTVYWGSTANIADNETTGYLEISGGAQGTSIIGPLRATGGMTIASSETFTNNGSYAGSPVVTSIDVGTGLAVSNPSSPGVATVSLSAVANTVLTGPLVQSITANNGLTIANPTGVGAATLGIGTGAVSNTHLAGPLLTSLNAGTGITVGNPSGVGAATVTASAIPNSALTGALVSSLTDTDSSITITNPTGVGAAAVSVNTAKALTWSGLATFTGGATIPSGATLTLNGSMAGTTFGGANGVATLDSTGNVPTSELGNVSKVVPPPPAASTTALGLVEVSDNPSSGDPIAVTTNNAAYEKILNANYLTAGTGITLASGTYSQQVTVSGVPNTALTGPLVTGFTVADGITASALAGVGSVSLGLSGVPNTSLAGPLLSGLTAGTNIAISGNPGSGIGAPTIGITGVIGSANLPADLAYLNASQTFVGTQTFTDATVHSVLTVQDQLLGAQGALASFSVLSSPTSLTAAVQTTGTVGTYLVASTTYYYTVTAVASDGEETNSSNVASGSEGTTAYPIYLAWNSVSNAVSYNIYKGTSSGALNFLANSTSASYTDAGSVATTSATPPVVNQTGSVSLEGELNLQAPGDSTGLTVGPQGVGNYQLRLNSPYGVLQQDTGLSSWAMEFSAGSNWTLFNMPAGGPNWVSLLHVTGAGAVGTANNTLDDGSGKFATTGTASIAYSGVGVDVIGTNASQLVAWWDNSANFGGMLIENDNVVGLGLVNKGTASYAGLNANSYTIPLYASPSGAVHTTSMMNSAIGTNKSPTGYIRNTLDDGAGNFSIPGVVTATAGLSSSGNLTLPSVEITGNQINSLGAIGLALNYANQGENVTIFSPLNITNTLTTAHSTLEDGSGDAILAGYIKASWLWFNGDAISIPSGATGLTTGSGGVRTITQGGMNGVQVPGTVQFGGAVSSSGTSFSYAGNPNLSHSTVAAYVWGSVSGGVNPEYFGVKAPGAGSSVVMTSANCTGEAIYSQS